MWMTHDLSPRLVSLPARQRQHADMQDECRGSLTSGGMWPRCICPTVTCCCGEGMLPTLKVSGPLEPERITAGRATEPCSTFPVRLNCCCKMVDLWGTGGLVTGSEVAAHVECHKVPQVSRMLASWCCGGQLQRGCTDRIVNADAALKCSVEP